mmetsp:Transcript_7932/g.23420  ORF Transcript_7932/g.23420 Transcript_7932/m.23420 type:complete len:438 (-) Transcript_7932:281-1594(-)
MVVGQVSQGNGHQAQEREEEPTTVPNGPRGGLGMGRVRRGGRSSRGMRGPRSEGETPGESAVVSQGALGVSGVASNSISLFEDGGSRDLLPACSVDNAAVDALVRRMPGSSCIARQSHDGDFVGLVRSGVHHSLLACCVAVAVALVAVAVVVVVAVVVAAAVRESTARHRLFAGRKLQSATDGGGGRNRAHQRGLRWKIGIGSCSGNNGLVHGCSVINIGIVAVVGGIGGNGGRRGSCGFGARNYRSLFFRPGGNRRTGTRRLWGRTARFCISLGIGHRCPGLLGLFLEAPQLGPAAGNAIVHGQRRGRRSRLLLLRGRGRNRWRGTSPAAGSRSIADATGGGTTALLLCNGRTASGGSRVVAAGWRLRRGIVPVPVHGVCVCMYVCLSVCLCVCLSACLCVCLSVCMSACVYVCLCVCACCWRSSNGNDCLWFLRC